MESFVMFYDFCFKSLSLSLTIVSILFYFVLSCISLLGRLLQVDQIKWVSNVGPPVRTSLRP